MERKKPPKKKHSIILRVMVLGVCLFLVFDLVGLYKTYNDSVDEYNKLKAKYNSLKADVDSRRDLLENGSQQQIIEQAARERLGYVYPNEEIYTDISGE